MLYMIVLYSWGIYKECIDDFSLPLANCYPTLAKLRLASSRVYSMEIAEMNA